VRSSACLARMYERGLRALLLVDVRKESVQISITCESCRFLAFSCVYTIFLCLRGGSMCAICRRLCVYNMREAVCEVSQVVSALCAPYCTL